jgi:hypothetical protein
MAESTSPAVAAPSAAPAPAGAPSAPAPAPAATAPAAPVLGELAAKPSLRPQFVPPPAEAVATTAPGAPVTTPAADKGKELPTAAEVVAEAGKATKTETPAATPEADEIAASLAALNRETRAARAAREKAEQEVAKLGDKVTQAEQLGKVRDSLKAKDVVGALRALDPDLNVDEAILTLLEQAKAADAQPLSQADIEKIAVAKFEEQQKAAAAAAEAENKAKIERANASYVDACGAEFQAAAGEFKLIGVLGVSKEKILEYTTQCWQKDRSVPFAVDTLKHFEAQYEEDLKRAGYTRAQIAQVAAGVQPTAAPAPVAAPAATGAIVGAAASDTGGAPSTPAKPQTLAEKIAARRAAIIQATEAR